MMTEKTATKTKRPKRLVYCERCGHPDDRHDASDGKHWGCQAKTIKKGAPRCKCPRMVYPVGGYMASLGQSVAREKVRKGEMPPPFEPPDEKKRPR